MTVRLGILALAVIVSGCGYALAGLGDNLPDHIRRIGVPTFQNMSTTPELDRIFTEAVRVELQSRGRYQVVPEATGVDAVLTGSIRSVTPFAANFTDLRQASRYTVTVVVVAEFKETRDNKVLFPSQPLSVSDEYEISSGAAAADIAQLFAQDRNALDRLAKTFARRLVTSILEAF
jgi:hypothetical protein